MRTVGKTRVLFVCLGNICRSPTAHGVLESKVSQLGLAHAIDVDSCGTAEWHTGRAPDPRSVSAALQRGYDLSHLRARQVQSGDFDEFDFILAMDRSNLADLQALCPATYPGHLGLFMSFAGSAAVREVPDPYYGGDDGFDHVLDLVEQASDGLLREICSAHSAK